MKRDTIGGMVIAHARNGNIHSTVDAKRAIDISDHGNSNVAANMYWVAINILEEILVKLEQSLEYSDTDLRAIVYELVQNYKLEE